MTGQHQQNQRHTLEMRPHCRLCTIHSSSNLTRALLLQKNKCDSGDKVTDMAAEYSSNVDAQDDADDAEEFDDDDFDEEDDEHAYAESSWFTSSLSSMIYSCANTRRSRKIIATLLNSSSKDISLTLRNGKGLK
mmetsp:Transcript_15190/g.23424  ORF Transcript_15190/g.23424 Transcript_15190/m.23424 type:complete len:134 (+) Transcript_15190:237-638(+)